jgi:alanine dehydrogenase
VGLPPTGVRLLSKLGHEVFVEKGAGSGAGFSDEDYRKAGADIVYTGEEAYGRASLVLKFARPSAPELEFVTAHQVVCGYLHLNAAPTHEVEPLRSRAVTAIAYERIIDGTGAHPVLKPLSQIGGRMSATLAARLLQNDCGSRGVLLGGVPGVPPAEVVIIGAGTAGENAARSFLGLGAQLTVLDKDLRRLQELEIRLPACRVTQLANPHTIATACSYADVVIGAVREPGARAPVVITRGILRGMRPGALFIDLSIDEGGCSETSRPTTHLDPTYVEEGVVHCCIPNLPAAVARTSSHAFQSAGWPYLERLVTDGIETVIGSDPGVANAVMLRDGEPVHYRPMPIPHQSGS